MPFTFAQAPAFAPAVASPHTEPTGQLAEAQQTLTVALFGVQNPAVHCDASVQTVPGAPVVTHVVPLHA